MVKKRVFETEAACDSCRATGIYVGMAERDGAGVVCHTCKGTGKVVIYIEYEDFTGRKIREGVRHVLQANPGMIVGEKKGSFSLQDFGGMSYEDFLAGKPFPARSEMRQFVCPAWWYQMVDLSLKPLWDECDFGRFSSCSQFPKKAECWSRWDREFGEKKEGART